MNIVKRKIPRSKVCRTETTIFDTRESCEIWLWAINHSDKEVVLDIYYDSTSPAIRIPLQANGGVVPICPGWFSSHGNCIKVKTETENANAEVFGYSNMDDPYPDARIKYEILRGLYE